jgi:hypothetical protein
MVGGCVGLVLDVMYLDKVMGVLCYVLLCFCLCDQKR